MRKVRVQHNWSLDTLRAISLLGVFFYHLSGEVFQFAYLGVVGFFCLAGYLSMRKVLINAENNTAPKPLLISLGNKASKLFPPLLFMLLVLTLVMILSFPTFLDHFAGQVRSAVLGFNNIWQILIGDSYFEGQGYLKPLKHIWALSLELQFYLLFSLIVERIYRKEQRTFWLVEFFLFTIFSVLALFVLYDGTGDPTRVYYGSDTRFFSFGLGAMAALIAEPKRDSGPVKTHLKAIVLFLLAIVSVAAYFAPVAPSLIIRYGLVIYSLLYFVMLMLSAQDEGPLSVVGKSAVVRYLCQRSYHIYLWHFPVFQLLERYLISLHLDYRIFLAVVALAALIISEISYQITQYMISMGPLFASSKRNQSYIKKNTIQARDIFALILMLALLIMPWRTIYVALGGERFRKLEDDIASREAVIKQERESLRQAQQDRAPSEVVAVTLDEVKPSQNENSNEKKQNKKTKVTTPEGWEIASPLHLPVAAQAPFGTFEFEDSFQYVEYFNSLEDEFFVDLDDYYRYRDIPITMIGDSVSVITSYHIFSYLPNLMLDALSNRQTADLWEVYLNNKVEGTIGEMLIVALGSNGDIDYEALENVWQDLQGKPMLILTIVLPYAETENLRNEAIKDFVKTHKNVYLVDWNHVAKGHPEYFQEDYIHPSEFGCKAFCQLLTAQIVNITRIYENSSSVSFYDVEDVIVSSQS